MKPEEYTVTAKTDNITCYRLRHLSGLYWADIIIDDDGANSARICIASDFGDWQRHWSHFGKSFKEFLIKIDIYYAAGKFGANKHFMFEETMEGYRKDILQARKDDYLTAEAARTIYTELEDLEKNSSLDAKDFQYYMYYNCPELMKYKNDAPDIRTGISPSFKMFWQNCWPVLVEEFRKELQATSVLEEKE